MSTTVSTLTLGMVGATPIVVSTTPNAFVSSGVKAVVIGGTDYVRTPIPHFPLTPAGADPSALATASTPHTYAAASTATFYAIEADQLISNGFATAA